MTIIERIATPLPGGRAQLVETLVVNGETIYSIKLGPPARMNTVRTFEETLTVANGRMTRRRGR